MLEIRGTFSTAKIYTKNVEETALTQIKILCDQEFSQNSKVRVMPDVHAGMGCVIGFTANLGDMVIPNIVGVDIGCGMLTVYLGTKKFSFQELDDIIRKFVPSGKEVHERQMVEYQGLKNLNCHGAIKNMKRIEYSLGTLGGGNHFIEVDVDEEGNKYLVIHTGSRNLGKQVAEHYQNMAFDLLSGGDEFWEARTNLIATYKENGDEKNIEKALKKLKGKFEAKVLNIPKNLCYLTGTERSMYLEDMKICQEYASINRKTIADIILKQLMNKNLKDFYSFETVHNYIDLESNIVRKGAVSAREDEKLLIPINMRDGSLICLGKGNEDWNNSAPHGAGRLFSRGAARDKFTLTQFKHSMEGIFTTSVGTNTLDECPMAYKDIEDIVSNIGPTVDVIKQIRPMYNFKAIE